MSLYRYQIQTHDKWTLLGFIYQRLDNLVLIWGGFYLSSVCLTNHDFALWNSPIWLKSVLEVIFKTVK